MIGEQDLGRKPLPAFFTSPEGEKGMILIIAHVHTHHLTVYKTFMFIISFDLHKGPDMNASMPILK